MRKSVIFAGRIESHLKSRRRLCRDRWMVGCDGSYASDPVQKAKLDFSACFRKNLVFPGHSSRPANEKDLAVICGSEAEQRINHLLQVRSLTRQALASSLVAPGLEVCIGSCRQEGAPCRFKASARGLERSTGPAATFARISAWIEAAAPFPLVNHRSGHRHVGRLS